MSGAAVPATLVLSANAAPAVGGQGLNLQQMAVGLSADFDVQVFARAAVPGLRSTVMAGSRMANALGRVPLLRRRRDWRTLLDDARFDRTVAARLPRAALAQGVTGQCLATLRRARSLGARTVVDSITMHVDQFVDAGSRECARFGVPFPIHPRLAERSRQEYEAADLIRVMSDRARRSFIERGIAADRTMVIRPFFEFGEVAPAALAGPTFRVVAVGALEPWKGAHYLVEAFRLFEARDTELHLCGGTTSRGGARYFTEACRRDQRIRIEPVDVHRMGLSAVYGRANVLVHASVSDGFAQVVAEAMASGLPVIVTDTTGAADLVDESVNGFVVPPRDPEAIAGRLARLAADSTLARRMGAAGRATAATLTRTRFRETYVPRLRELLAG